MTNKENRKVKDSVFVDLFYSDESAEANERSLYEAINQVHLSPDCTIQKFRIDQQIYMNFQNDISFQINQNLLVFGEHQSTINTNMPLRNLMICGRAYEMLIPTRSRYKKGLIKIPKPEFYTFYNGTDPMEKEMLLRLSDAFLTDHPDTPSVDLTVRVININPDAGHEILDRCPVLKQYSQFIDTIRKYQKYKSKEPYKAAIHECMENGILTDYLRRRGNEVENMLMAEYDYNTDIEVQREEAEELGIAIGEKQGIAIGEKRGIAIGEKQGIAIGEKQGIAIGEKQGIAIGERKTHMENIRKLYAKKWSVADIAAFVEMPENEVREIIQSLSAESCN